MRRLVEFQSRHATVAALCLAVCLLGTATSTAQWKTFPKAIIEIKGIAVSVELARTLPEREKGLMFRDALDPDAGMLFIFEKPHRLSFWMKNTSIPLSIAFIDSEGRIAQIEDMTPFEQTPVLSETPCLYALEMNKGWFQKNEVKPGDRVTLPDSVATKNSPTVESGKEYEEKAQ